MPGKGSTYFVKNIFLGVETLPTQIYSLVSQYQATVRKVTHFPSFLLWAIYLKAIFDNESK